MTTIAIGIVNLESIQTKHNSHKLYCIPFLIPCLMGFYLPIYSDSKSYFIQQKKSLHLPKEKMLENPLQKKVTLLLKKIKNVRFEKEITQYEMSARLNMSQNCYHKLENGKTKLDVFRLMKISNILEYDFSVHLSVEINEEN